MITVTLPRFVIAKQAKTGLAYYWNPPPYWKKQAESAGRKWIFQSAALGVDLKQSELDQGAAPHNQRFDEWRVDEVTTRQTTSYASQGSVEWLFEQYLSSETFTRRVGERSRRDYRLIFDQVASLPTRDGRRVGALTVMSITPAAAEKIYSKMIADDKHRRGEKAVMYCKTAWRLMRPHHPREFPKEVPNPWEGVQIVRRTKQVKHAADRDMVYTFADAALAADRPELAAAAVICFEWLQRPENVIAGYIRWTDYKPGISIRIEHHKTGVMITHPLSAIEADGTTVMFYADAESVLKQLPKRGVSMILGPDDQQYKGSRFAQLVRRCADLADLPKTFTLDSCRHGGMTELEEAELTDGQGRALSAHRSKAYDGYAKRTEKRMLSATRQRHNYLAKK